MRQAHPAPRDALISQLPTPTQAGPTGSASRGRRLVRALVAAAIWAAVVAVAVPVAARLTGWQSGPLVPLVSVLPWMGLAGVVPVVAALATRRWIAGAVAAAVVAVTAATQAPLVTGATPAQGGAGGAVTVVTANLSFGEADPDAIVALVRDAHADVLAVQELTPDAVEALTAAGLDDILPYRAVKAERGATGTGLWSATPFSGVRFVDGLFSWSVVAVTEVNDREVTLWSAHPRAPGFRVHDRWEKDLALLADQLDEVRGPVIVAGDFNATRDHAPFRAIEARGYSDAADQAGSGLVPTFPEGLLPVPVVAIDHVLERDTGWVATDVASVSIPGTDHRALVVTYST